MQEEKQEQEQGQEEVQEEEQEHEEGTTDAETSRTRNKRKTQVSEEKEEKYESNRLCQTTRASQFYLCSVLSEISCKCNNPVKTHFDKKGIDDESILFLYT